MRVEVKRPRRPLQAIHSGPDLHHASQYQTSLSAGEFIDCAKLAAGDPEELARAAGGVGCPTWRTPAMTCRNANSKGVMIVAGTVG